MGFSGLMEELITINQYKYTEGIEWLLSYCTHWFIEWAQIWVYPAWDGFERALSITVLNVRWCTMLWWRLLQNWNFWRYGERRRRQEGKKGRKETDKNLKWEVWEERGDEYHQTKKKDLEIKVSQWQDRRNVSSTNVIVQSLRLS